MDNLSDDQNQLKAQPLVPDMGPFVIELDGRGTVCLRSDSIYELTKYDGSNVQVTGLVSQDGISFFPISSDLTQTDDMYMEHPMFINVPIENHGNEFILNEDAIAIPINDVVARKDFQGMDNCELTDISSQIGQFSEFDNKVSILELVDTPEARDRSLLQQSVIRKHQSCDVVCEFTPLNTFVIDSTAESNVLIPDKPETDVLNAENINSIIEGSLDSEEQTNEESEAKEEGCESSFPSESASGRAKGRAEKDEEIEPPIRKGPFSCETCNVRVPTWNRLKAHKLAHVKESKPYKCRVCPASFNVEKNLRLHLLLHNVGNLTCTECGKAFTRFASFKAHLPVHEEEENVFCSECGDEFTNSAQLEQHLQKHRTEWKKTGNGDDESKPAYSCKTCERVFTDHVDYECHKKDHQRLRNQLQALAPKRKKKRFRKLAGGGYGNECSVCKKSFPKPSQLVRHIRIHTGEKPFKCAICSAAFSQKGSLQIHMSKHNGYKPHVCSCCSLSFSQRGNLITHVNKAHRIPKEGEEIYKCVKCSCSFKKLASLNCHVTRFHMGIRTDGSNSEGWEQGDSEADLLNPVGDLQNDFSEDNDADILQRAIRISGLPLSKSGNRPVPRVGLKLDGSCPIDDPSGNVRVVTIADKTDGGNVKHFSVRQRREGTIRWHQCNVCLKEFKKPSDLIRHFRIHTRERPFKCNECHRTFSIKSTLKSHVRTHLNSTMQECNTCGKKMTTVRSLRIHERCHSGEKPFTCDVCTKSFTTSGQLKSHQATNLHKTKVDIPPDDPEPVNNNYFFEEPFLIVGDGEFRQQLSRKEKLISRSQNASRSERPHECEYCHLKFRKSSHLKQHILQHTGEKPFSCFVCHKNFTTNGVLKTHLKTHLGQKDYCCDRCTSKFSTKGSLKRHADTFHSEDRRFMCPYCQKRFKTSVNCRKHIKIHRYEKNQQLYKVKLNGVDSEEKALEEEEVTMDCVEEPSSDKSEPEEATDQTLLADSTGTITLSALNQEALTQESIRELEQTLNQQLFGSEQGPEYTVQMISTEEGVKESDFMDPSLLSKPLILNVDETIREPSIVHAVFSQTEELQTVSNMSEILPETTEPKSDFGDMNDSNDKENEEGSFCGKEDKDLSCDVCGKLFADADSLEIHSKSHEEKKEFNCDLCGWSTLTRASFRRHCSIHNDVKKFSCPECPAKFRLEVHLRKHQKLHEAPKEDGNCKTGRRSKGPFREFSEAETELLAAQDVRNGASVSEKVLIESAAEKVRIDERKKLEEQPEKDSRSNFGNDCKYCHKSFKKPSDLKRHVRVHTGERPFQCAQCNKCFRVKSTLSTHLRTHYRVKPVVCHICQSMFAAKSSLKVHMRLHTGAKPFECTLCGERFRTSGHRKNHLLAHAKNKPQTLKKDQLQMLNKIAVALVVNLSDENELNKDELRAVQEGELQQAFENNDINAIQSEADNEALLLQLNDQNNIVQLLSQEQGANEVVPTGEGNPQQPVQFQIYTTDGQVYITHPNSDLIICSDENGDEKRAVIENVESEEGKPEIDPAKSHICHFCQKGFSKKSLLVRHVRIHTGERPYACDLCGRRFTQSNALKTHLKAHQGDREYACPYCDFTCVQKGNLRIHVSRTHQFAYFLRDENTNEKLRSEKSDSSLLSDSLLKTPHKSPTGDIDQVMGELFPQVT